MRTGRKRHALVLVCLVSLIALPLHAGKTSAYTASFTRWSAAGGGFSAWQRSGVRLTAAQELQLDPATALSGTDPYAAGGYNGGNFYNGASFMVGEAISPIVTPASAFYQAIPSWNAATPAGTWVEAQVRARVGTTWTKWYNLGAWDDDNSTVRRHSVKAQGDAAGSVSTDTLMLNTKNAAANAFQLKLRLFSTPASTSPGCATPASPPPRRPPRPRHCSPVIPRNGTASSTSRNARRWSTPTAATSGAARRRRRWCSASS